MQKFTSKEYIANTLSLEDKSWKKLDNIMSAQRDEAVENLANIGIAEGDPDDESDEGQVWQMIEGRLPYSLDMV